MSNKYCGIWRNKFLTTDAQNIDDIISGLSAALNTLREMRECGVALEGGAEDDYAMLVTRDSEVAQRFGFEAAPEQQEDDFYGSLAEQVAADCGLTVIEP